MTTNYTYRTPRIIIFCFSAVIKVTTVTTTATVTASYTATCATLLPTPQFEEFEVRFYSFIGALSLETVIVVILVIVVVIQCCRQRPKNGPPQPNMFVQWWRRNYGAVAQRDD